MESFALVAIALSILGSAAISRRIQGTIVTLPMVYTGLGILVGSLGLGWLDMDLDNHLIHIVAELTLIAVLASDASRINLTLLRSDHSLPQRLLSIGLLLTMMLGALVAYWMFGRLGFWGAAVLAVILAPTDASLGQSVVNNPSVPQRIRQALNIESGLNDGIAMPFLLLAIALAVAADLPGTGASFIVSALIAIFLAVVVGAAVGWLGVRFVGWGHKSGWMSTSFQKLSIIGLVLLTFGLAELIGGNGYIAAFCTGLVAGSMQKPDEAKELFEHLETEVDLLILLTFVFFGAVLLPLALDNLSVSIVVYALLSLTVIRMLPVALSLLESGIRPVTALFIGWFGPRGTASILYILTVLEVEEFLGVDLIYDIAMTTVFLSVILHGISAAPGANWYGRSMEQRSARSGDLAENEEVAAVPVRTSA